MANIKLGAIVSDIQGSIGGTTFRRTPHGHSAYNKQKKQLLSARSLNSRRIELANVFQGWSKLSDKERKQINEQSKLFQFPDKFGNMKNLTGRQLYTKLTSQLLPTGLTVPSWATLDSNVDAPEISDIDVSLGDKIFDIYLKSAVTVARVLISAKPKPKTGNVKPHAHFRTMLSLEAASLGSVDFYDIFMENYPLATAGECYQVNVYAVNNYGFKSPVSAFSVILQ